MKKDALRSGNIVELRTGDKFLVTNCGGQLFLINGNKWANLADYNNDMTMPEFSKADIIAVYRTPFRSLETMFEKCDDTTIIWGRESIDWRSVPVDAKIEVREGGESYFRHYAGIKDGKPAVWLNGLTSFTKDISGRTTYTTFNTKTSKVIE